MPWSGPWMKHQPIRARKESHVTEPMLHGAKYSEENSRGIDVKERAHKAGQSSLNEDQLLKTRLKRIQVKEYYPVSTQVQLDS